MNRVDRIVDLIDNALDDYSASGDAMRWTPEPAAAPMSDVDYDQRPLSWSEGIVWDLVHPPRSDDAAISVSDFYANYDLAVADVVTCTIAGEDGLFRYEVIQRRSESLVSSEWSSCSLSSWLTTRPILPAESVYVGLSEPDLSAWP